MLSINQDPTFPKSEVYIIYFQDHDLTHIG